METKDDQIIASAARKGLLLAASVIATLTNALVAGAGCGHSSSASHWSEGGAHEYEASEPASGGRYADEIEDSQRREGWCFLAHFNDPVATEVCQAREQTHQVQLRQLELEAERNAMVSDQIADAARQNASEAEAQAMQARAAEARAAEARAAEARAAEAQASRDNRALAEGEKAPPWWCFEGVLAGTPTGACRMSADACASKAAAFAGIDGATVTRECHEQPLAACVQFRNIMRNKVAAQCYVSTLACESVRAKVLADPDDDNVSECLRAPTTWLRSGKRPASDRSEPGGG